MYEAYISLHFCPQFKFLLPCDTPPQDTYILLNIFDDITKLFQKYMCSNLDKRSAIIRFDTKRSNPSCNKNEAIITLVSNLHVWNQTAYQFSHELCHFCISNDVSYNLRWFEESICAMASTFFLHKLTELWTICKVHYKTCDGELYAPFFSSYATNKSPKAQQFDLHDSSIISGLEKDCYQRPLNRYVANQLLPIFTAQPHIWQTIPLLCNIPANLSIQESIKYWIQISPDDYKNELMKVLWLFDSNQESAIP